MTTDSEIKERPAKCEGCRFQDGLNCRAGSEWKAQQYQDKDSVTNASYPNGIDISKRFPCYRRTGPRFNELERVGEGFTEELHFINDYAKISEAKALDKDNVPMLRVWRGGEGSIQFQIRTFAPITGQPDGKPRNMIATVHIGAKDLETIAEYAKGPKQTRWESAGATHMAPIIVGPNATAEGSEPGDIEITKYHDAWVIVTNEHERDGYHLKPLTWEGPGEYRRVETKDARDGLLKVGGKYIPPRHSYTAAKDVQPDAYVDPLADYAKGLATEWVKDHADNAPAEFVGLTYERRIALIAERVTPILRRGEVDAVQSAVAYVCSLIRASKTKQRLGVK